MRALGRRILVLFLMVSVLLSPLTMSGCAFIPSLHTDEDDGIKTYNDEHDFLDDYEAAVLDALAAGSEDDLRDLFAEIVTDNNADIDDGIEYVLGMTDWDEGEIVVTDDNVSSYVEYGGEFEGAEYEHLVKSVKVSCKVTVSIGDKTFRIFFGGFGNYIIKVNHLEQHVPEMIGLTYLRVHELDSDGNIIDDNEGSLWLDGVYYPERASFELAADMLLNNEGRNVDGSWMVDTSDEAVEDRISRYFDEDVLAGFDEDELEGLRLLMNRDDLSKKFLRSYLITEDGSQCLILFFYFTMGNRCLVLRFDEDKITGAALGYENEYGDIHADYGELSGFEQLVG